MEEFIVGTLFAMWFLFYFAFKVFTTVDDDGEIKKTASKGIASWIERMLK